jgi:hypothetical protein
MDIQENKKVVKETILSKKESLQSISPKRELKSNLDDKKKKEKKCKKRKKNKSKKCKICNKKVGVVLYTCKCNTEYIFCGKHKLPNNHECTFDFKEYYKKQITQNNPKIEFDKFNKF